MQKGIQQKELKLKAAKFLALAQRARNKVLQLAPKRAGDDTTYFDVGLDNVYNIA